MTSSLDEYISEIKVKTAPERISILEMLKRIDGLDYKLEQSIEAFLDELGCKGWDYAYTLETRRDPVSVEFYDLWAEITILRPKELKVKFQK